MKTMKYHEFDILIKYVFENNPPKVCKLKPSRKIADTKIKKANLELRLLINKREANTIVITRVINSNIVIFIFVRT